MMNRGSQLLCASYGVAMTFGTVYWASKAL